jgi:SAM-dependent methyltransferase
MTKLFIKEHHWKPIESVIDKLIDFCKSNNYKNVVEIGPGNIQFPLAIEFIGHNEKIDNYINIDINETKFPYLDKDIDFIYSRHTMEDLDSPQFAINEIIRCCKSGYIETPSPLIETTKGVDGNQGGLEKMYAGYIHHRFIIWSNIEKCEIYILPKYNSVIDHFLKIDYTELGLDKLIENPIYWNNYFIWKDRIPKVIVYKNNIDINPRHFVQEYCQLIQRAINESIQTTDYFLNNF